jgi:hypothetical protein
MKSNLWCGMIEDERRADFEWKRVVYSKYEFSYLSCCYCDCCGSEDELALPLG